MDEDKRDPWPYGAYGTSIVKASREAERQKNQHWTDVLNGWTNIRPVTMTPEEFVQQAQATGITPQQVGGLLGGLTPRWYNDDTLRSDWKRDRLCDRLSGHYQQIMGMDLDAAAATAQLRVSSWDQGDELDFEIKVFDECLAAVVAKAEAVPRFKHFRATMRHLFERGVRGRKE